MAWTKLDVIFAESDVRVFAIQKAIRIFIGNVF